MLLESGFLFLLAMILSFFLVVLSAFISSVMIRYLRDASRTIKSIRNKSVVSTMWINAPCSVTFCIDRIFYEHAAKFANGK